MAERKSWRFIPYEVFDAATNMAVDEAILEAHLQGFVPPTLRFYGWSKAAVSIGHSQSLPDNVVEYIKNAGYDLVRRPTGGRAVLHDNELTYSFVGSEGLGVSILDAYEQICRGLIEGLESFGVKAGIGKSGVSCKDLQDCFLATTGSDLQVDGKKIAGSAQLRRKHAVLQHGSILLKQEQDALPSLLAAGGEQKSNGARHVNLFELLGAEPSCPELSERFRQGFSRVFGAEFVESELTAKEKSLILV